MRARARARENSRFSLKAQRKNKFLASQTARTDRQPARIDRQPGLRSKFQESGPLPETSIPYTTGKKNLHFSANFRSEAFCRLWQPARQTDKQPTRQTNSQPARTDRTDRQPANQTASKTARTDRQTTRTVRQPGLES